MKRNDFILIGTLLGIVLVLFLVMLLAKQNTVNGEAVVLIEGREYGRYPLSMDRVVEIPGLLGNNVLTISDGKARMSAAVCPDKICMNFGEIHYNTDMIVCLPGSIVVLIENGEAPKVDVVGQ